MRAVHWSKKTDELVRQVAAAAAPALQAELGAWLEQSPAFNAFVTANRDKIRKKLASSADAQMRLDVRAELRVAYLVLADRRFDVGFETYGARQPGPDLSLAYRTNYRFNLEVTRLRTAPGEPHRLASVIATKVRQLPRDVPNVLVVTGTALGADEEVVGSAVKILKVHTNEKDDAFFTRRGLKDARHFYAQFLHLSGVVVLDETTPAIFVANRDTRRPLSVEVVRHLVEALSPA